MKKIDKVLTIALVLKNPLIPSSSDCITPILLQNKDLNTQHAETFNDSNNTNNIFKTPNEASNVYTNQPNRLYSNNDQAYEYNNNNINNANVMNYENNFNNNNPNAGQSNFYFINLFLYIIILISQYTLVNCNKALNFNQNYLLQENIPSQDYSSEAYLVGNNNNANINNNINNSNIPNTLAYKDSQLNYSESSSNKLDQKNFILGQALAPGLEPSQEQDRMSSITSDNEINEENKEEKSENNFEGSINTSNNNEAVNKNVSLEENLELYLKNDDLTMLEDYVNRHFSNLTQEQMINKLISLDENFREKLLILVMEYQQKMANQNKLNEDNNSNTINNLTLNQHQDNLAIHQDYEHQQAGYSNNNIYNPALNADLKMSENHILHEQSEVLSENNMNKGKKLKIRLFF